MPRGSARSSRFVALGRLSILLLLALLPYGRPKAMTSHLAQLLVGSV